MSEAIIAVTAVRNEEQHLPGMLSHLRGHVEGVFIVDDASTDRTPQVISSAGSFVLGCRTLEGSTPDHQRESSNRFQLYSMVHTLWHGPQRGPGRPWLLCVDADERLELEFLRGLKGICKSADSMGLNKVTVWLRELWHSPRTYRVGSKWDGKRKVVLFRLPEKFSARAEGALHDPWFPPEMWAEPSLRVNANMYHLSMLTAHERHARRIKFQRIDGSNAAIYDYLSEEKDVELEAVSAKHNYALE